MTNPRLQPSRPSRPGRMRDNVLEPIKSERAGLSRGESLVRLQRKGGKAGETSVSNALPAAGNPLQPISATRACRLNCALNERIPSFRLQPKLRIARMNQLTEKQKKLVWRYVELWRCGSQDRAGGAQARLLTV